MLLLPGMQSTAAVVIIIPPTHCCIVAAVYQLTAALSRALPTGHRMTPAITPYAFAQRHSTLVQHWHPFALHYCLAITRYTTPPLHCYYEYC
ncbi:hypothetical protein COO60DRAFT_1504810 [Scenedesmus sp. NREL 46B-D3]|nr:hypothetical protein COO60DRAFT_1504810 [Scenedesmus sp. NREL 46B-D3]